MRSLEIYEPYQYPAENIIHSAMAALKWSQKWLILELPLVSQMIILKLGQILGMIAFTTLLAYSKGKTQFAPLLIGEPIFNRLFTISLIQIVGY